MIRLFAVNILPLKDAACYEKCYLRSSGQRQEKADALAVPADKARCIAAGLLLEYSYEKFRSEYIKELAKANSFGYVQGYAKLLPEEMPEIISGFRGKPEFVFPEDTEKLVYFNLSHSGNYVICAMADFEVGADIQRRTRVRESVLRQFFSAEEKKQMEMCGDDEMLRERTFAGIWAVNEAQTKLTGRGIGQMLGSMLKDAVGIENVTEEPGYRIWQGCIGEDYAWAIAGGTQGTPELIMVDEGELFYE